MNRFLNKRIRDFFFDAMIAYSRSEIDTTRKINLGGITSKAKSTTNGNMATLGFQAGLNYGGDSFYFSPIYGLSYTKSIIDGFTEKGSSLAMKIDEQDYDSLLNKLGFRTGFIAFAENEDNAYWTCEFRAFYLYEMLDTDRNSCS